MWQLIKTILKDEIVEKKEFLQVIKKYKINLKGRKEKLKKKCLYNFSDLIF